MSANSEAYDYVIVGAGSAGCTLADALSRDGDRTVCVLEAGGADDRVSIRTPMFLQQAMRDPEINWGYETAPQAALNDRRLFWPRGKTLGGSSSINAMHYIRGASENYDEWAERYGAAGWDWPACLEAFKRVERQARGPSALHGADGQLWVQDIAPLHPLTERFLDAARALQIPDNPDFNGERQEGVGIYQVTQKETKRCSAAVAFLHPAMERPNVKVITNALAARVIMDGAKAVGVEAQIGGERREVLARREVILSGGAINSPQLLQLSGIGDPGHLREVGVSPVIDLPGVGANLQDHLDVTARMETRSALSIGYSWRSAGRVAGDLMRWAVRGDGPLTVNPVQGGAFVRSSRANALPDVQLVFIPGPSSPHGREYVFGHGVTLHGAILYPKSRGAIRIASADPTEHPVIDPRYGEEEEDLAVLAEALTLCRRVLASSVFADERVREVLPGPEVETADQLMADVRARAETLYHPTSTCAMGTGALAVCDERLRVRGAENLRVVDASVMPRLVGGNTNAPTIMIATRAGDMIREDGA